MKVSSSRGKQPKPSFVIMGVIILGAVTYYETFLPQFLNSCLKTRIELRYMV
jgi:hypothetical protein